MIRFLEGEKLYLRPVEKEDMGRFLEWVNDGEIRYLQSLDELPFNMAREEQWFDEMNRKENSIFLAICTGDNGLIGSIFLRIHQKNGLLGIMIGEKSCWNRGYGSEAIELLLRHGFDSLNLHRVELKVFEFNERAIGCYEKIGFKREGIGREVVFKRGHYWNEIQMSILDWEWRKKV